MGRMRLLYAPLAVAAMLAGVSACGSSSQARQDSSSLTVTSARAGGAAGARLVRVGTFDQPLTVTAAPGDRSRVYVVERGGRVQLLLNGHKQSKPFLDISGSVNDSGGEQGLLGLAFPRDYGKTGLFYVDYTTSNNDIRVAQFKRSAGNPNAADAGSGHTVLTIDHHAYTNHNGGQLAFGPDGFLYIGVGDGGSEGDPNSHGQSTNTLLAKILRISPSAGGGYTIPSSNPFAGKAGHRGEIWAFGLRNPWRFSFDAATGDLIVGDVGQDKYEEIDFQRAGQGAGANYGWSIWEARSKFKDGTAPHARFPQIVAPHSAGYCAIIGGFVVRDRSVRSLYGRYLFSDNCRAQIEAVRLSARGASGLHATGLKVTSASSFGEDAAHHIYISSLEGPVYRLAQR
jgi:glucose/arabinose dehydrogenase